MNAALLGTAVATDAGFASRPLLLLVVILMLNLAAILLRNRLRKKFAATSF